MLADAAAQAIDRLIVEHDSDRLAAVGLEPTRSLLLAGDPGVGKTLLATWIAHRLDRPLLRLDLADLMSSELGASGRALKASMRTAASTGSVLFIDELDALARTRGEGQDVGEARRLVNILLVEMDLWPPGHLLVAATNHREMLDPAVLRRFELELDLPLPSIEIRSHLLMNAWRNYATEESVQQVAQVAAEVTGGWSHADVRRFAIRSLRNAVTSEQPLVETALTTLAETSWLNRASRDAVTHALRDLLNLSDREIGRRLGISHPTVASGVQRHRRHVEAEASQSRDL